MNPDTTKEKEAVFLTKILEWNAWHTRDSAITVTVDRRLDTVDIEDTKSGESRFLQGDDAVQFIRNALANWEESGMISQQTAYDAEAYHYLDLLT